MVHDRASELFVPVFYILSTSRTGDARWDMMHFVLQAIDQQLSLTEVICDYEYALIEAAKTEFRDASRLCEAEFIVAMTKGVADMLIVVNPEHVRTRGVKWTRLEIQRQVCPATGWHTRGRVRRVPREVIELSVPVDLSEELNNTAEVEAKSHEEHVTYPATDAM
ncbi:Hypothetical protein PHPALM_17973 [Phytophthora palmivora]|uniref:MULE transposase domain-containing protein n=1 Tax=Phytophthora palmivora TaxID=4796 RepID=A0A2P4XKZ2_9STRA|nr:Hypothetical protein PHPALM_17973 [Phytophthora palmivora]